MIINDDKFKSMNFIVFSCCVYKFFNDKGNTYDSLEKSYVKVYLLYIMILTIKNLWKNNKFKKI